MSTKTQNHPLYVEVRDQHFPEWLINKMAGWLSLHGYEEKMSMSMVPNIFKQVTGWNFDHHGSIENGKVFVNEPYDEHNISNAEVADMLHCVCLEVPSYWLPGKTRRFEFRPKPPVDTWTGLQKKAGNESDKPAEPEPELTIDKALLTATCFTAEERGQQMMMIPMNDLPLLATQYAKYMCYRYGMCGETLLTAWMAYAQCIEGLPCTTKPYVASPEAVEWFSMFPSHKQETEKHEESNEESN